MNGVDDLRDYPTLRQKYLSSERSYSSL